MSRYDWTDSERLKVRLHIARLTAALKAQRDVLDDRELQLMEGVGFNHGYNYSDAFKEKACRAQDLAKELTGGSGE